jgi:hypothetical protein
MKKKIKIKLASNIDFYTHLINQPTYIHLHSMAFFLGFFLNIIMVLPMSNDVFDTYELDVMHSYDW